MHLAPVSEPTLVDHVRGIPLTVLFADGDAIARVRERGHGALTLSPPFHVSDEDAYLVLPEDVGLELVDMFRDGDVDLLAEAMRDGIVALGGIEKQGRAMALEVDECEPAERVLKKLGWVETVALRRGVDPIEHLNEMDHVRCTVASSFVDLVGLASMVRSAEFAGASWRVPKDAAHLAGVDPTYAWSKRLPDGRISVECALFSEYEELAVVLRPALLVQSDAIRLAPSPG